LKHSVILVYNAHSGDFVFVRTAPGMVLLNADGVFFAGGLPIRHQHYATLQLTVYLFVNYKQLVSPSSPHFPASLP